MTAKGRTRPKGGAKGKGSRKAKPNGPKREAGRKPAASAVRKSSASAPRKASASARAKPSTTACLVCGSSNLDVRKKDGPARIAGKVIAGVVVPFILEFHDRVTCQSCGWRSEASY